MSSLEEVEACASGAGRQLRKARRQSAVGGARGQRRGVGAHVLGRSSAVRSLLAAGSVQRPFMGHGRACKRCTTDLYKSLFGDGAGRMKSLSSQLLLTEQSPWPCGVAGALSGLPTAAESFMTMVRVEAGGSAHAAAVRSRSPRALAADSRSFSPMIDVSCSLGCISQKRSTPVAPPTGRCIVPRTPTHDRTAHERPSRCAPTPRRCLLRAQPLAFHVVRS